MTFLERKNDFVRDFTTLRFKKKKVLSKAENAMGSTSSSSLKMKDQQVFVLASRETADVCRDVFEKEFEAVVVVTKTVKETIEKLNNTKKPVGCVVAALGTNKENRLFDDNSSDASALIDAAKALRVHVFVYSHTACMDKNRWMALACEDAGADAVVCSRDSLRDVVTSFLASRTMRRMKSDENDVKEHKMMMIKARAPSPTDDKHWINSYPPLRRRCVRDEFLQRKLGSAHNVVRGSKRDTRHLKKYLERLKRPLLVSDDNSSRVRFVTVSDTHNCHGHLRFDNAEADVLLHTGDCVGNYRRENVHEHFKGFVKWLIEMSKRFKHVVFIAGISLSLSLSLSPFFLFIFFLNSLIHNNNNNNNNNNTQEITMFNWITIDRRRP